MRAARVVTAAAVVALLAAVAMTAEEVPMLLLVQTGQAVDVTQADGGDLYTIKISGASPKTAVFTNRPAHRADLSPTARVIAALKPTPEDPVNAALVYPQDGAAGEDVAALVELAAGSFDVAAGVLTYTAQPLPVEHEFGDATNHNKPSWRSRAPLVAWHSFWTSRDAPTAQATAPSAAIA